MESSKGILILRAVLRENVLWNRLQAISRRHQAEGNYRFAKLLWDRWNEWLERDRNKDAELRLTRAHQAGMNANDNNRRVTRTGRGQWIDCPHAAGTPEDVRWRDGYQYRDMINDG